MIPLYYILQINYSTAIVGIGGNVQLCNHGDGNGDQINSWDVPGVVQPTADELLALQNDSNTVNTYQAKLNAEANAPILAQLDALDLKSIRALREPDPTYLATLASQAVALRAQLLPMTAAGVAAAKTSGGTAS